MSTRAPEPGRPPASRARPARRGTPDWQREQQLRAAPGRRAIILGAVTVGVVLLAVQLWLLTVAVDLYLGGEGDRAWSLAVASGLVFAGGLFAYRLLRHEPPLPRR